MLGFRFTEGCLLLYFVLLLCWHVLWHLAQLRVSIVTVTFVLHRETFNWNVSFTGFEVFDWKKCAFMKHFPEINCVFSDVVLVHVYFVINYFLERGQTVFICHLFKNQFLAQLYYLHRCRQTLLDRSWWKSLKAQMPYCPSDILLFFHVLFLINSKL